MAWQAHSEEHMRDLPLKCNMAVFRHNVVRPALCPACLRDKKFHQFLSLTTWKTHLSDHILNDRLDRCPHPRYANVFSSSSKEDVLNHLADVHEIRFKSRKRQQTLHRDAEGYGMQNLSFVPVDPALLVSPVNGDRAGDQFGPGSVDDVETPHNQMTTNAHTYETRLLAATNSFQNSAQGEGNYDNDDHTATIEGVQHDDSHFIEDRGPRAPSMTRIACETTSKVRTKVHGVQTITIQVPPVPDWWYNDGIPCVDMLSDDEDGAVITQVPK